MYKIYAKIPFQFSGPIALPTSAFKDLFKQTKKNDVRRKYTRLKGQCLIVNDLGLNLIN